MKWHERHLRHLSQAPILDVLDFSKIFIVETDASSGGMCAVLMQDLKKQILHCLQFCHWEDPGRMLLLKSCKVFSIGVGSG